MSRNSAGDSCLTALIMLPILLILEMFSGGKKNSTNSSGVTPKGCFITFLVMAVIGWILQGLEYVFSQVQLGNIFGEHQGSNILGYILIPVLLYFVVWWIKNIYKHITHPVLVLDSPGDLNSSNLSKIANNKIEELHINYNPKYIEESPFHILRNRLTNIRFSIVLGPSVVTTSCMFSDCEKLTSAPYIDTSKVKDMSGMFRNCKSLVYAPDYDMSNVTNTNLMFAGCSSLQNVPRYKTDRLTSLTGMFEGCTKIRQLPKFNVAKVPGDQFNLFQQSIKQTFGRNLDKKTREAWGLVTAARLYSPLDIDFITEQLIYKNIAEYIFIDYKFCRPPRDDETRSEYIKWMEANNPFFRVRSKLTEIKVPIILGPSVTSVSHMFCGCTELRSIDSIEMPNVIDCSYMFAPLMNKDNLFDYDRCSNLSSLPTVLDTSRVKNFEGMFLGCSALKTIPKMDFGVAENLKVMFAGCNSLEIVGQIYAPKVTSASYLFSDCSKLAKQPNVTIAKDADSAEMFLGTDFA